MSTALAEPPFADLAVDIRRHAKRLHSLGPEAEVNVRAELVNNIYPLLQAILEAVDARVAPIEGAVDELLGDEESTLQPELAEDIKRVFALGAQLAEVLAQLIPAADDMTKKRYASAIDTYAVEMHRVAALVDDATLVEDDDDGGDDGGGEEADEEDEDEEDEPTVAKEGV